MQNHLLQFLSLVTMEAPSSTEPEDISAEKVKVLRSMKAELNDIVIGQYIADKEGKHKGYKVS
jgi:glucose-6-phosphate 1-dehydrogenase